MADTTYLVPEWHTLDYQTPTAADISRHFLFLGETGSGKTESGIKPVCRLALDYNQGQSAAALIIDPKEELLPFVGQHMAKQECLGQLVDLQELRGKSKIWVFEDWGNNLRGADAIADRLLGYSRSYLKQSQDTKDPVWHFWGQQLMTALIRIDWCLFHHPNNAGMANIEAFWEGFSAYLREINILVSNKPSEASLIDGDNYMSRLRRIITKSFFGISPARVNMGVSALKHEGNTFNSYWYHFTEYANTYLIGKKNVFTDVETEYFAQFLSMAPETYASIVGVLDTMIRDLMDPQISTLISMDPFNPPSSKFSVATAISSGKIVVYSPQYHSSVADTIGRIVKSQFFHAAMQRSRLNNPSARPFFYVCDEFHRYISSDEESGEQSFIDRCRAFRVCCVLATQSVAALRYELPSRQGDEAIKVILSNIGHKFFFRSTDPDTTMLLKGLFAAPATPYRPHLITVRPPTTLATGECYFLLPSGRSGRSQIELQVDDFIAA